ncbi:DEAD/DEAH box helicase and helicase conserved C-terminal domain containing protein, putative [Babesia bigemina]|uniref:RNA helicase n=1 Tax=Babesia bigemina TaxID=5866 RepID=A0A061D4F0_BABBI|nr:DEAD/DEAH box helicase and helicase conserved C-terminal domain containing protein, putative [Babesia bigemina]CDR95611.1 DEAD/DEAH box helicase and helicase conserved C-terminal domain containing protein, putative [Babesia bigemina]|eukprot:XP_012767797.1 DEAD/DEAH box helicase and helicase conserved C-terminal domain containing protein, putative [Babesia bigemina]
MKSDSAGASAKKKAAGGTGAFGLLGLNKTLCYALEHRLRYKQPSAIQRKTIPAVLQGRDIVCIARTGSGKTVAYLAPIVQMLESHSRTVGLRCLVLLPSRELALQVASVLKKFINFSKQADALRSATLIGGEALESQFGALTFNPDIAVATPGRLSQHIVEKSIELNLLSHFIIDEADKLFEMGFLPDVYRIFSMLPEKRQTVLASATLPSEITDFVKFGLRNPVVAQVDKDMQINEQLELRFIYTRTEDKIAVLVKLLRFSEENERTIVFVATKHHVEFFRALLAATGLTVSAVYGAMDMTARSQQMSLFRSCKTKVLIVTDLAARGLDLPMVDCVVNFDFPHSSKLFIHRVGRTARAGRQGTALSLVTPYDFAFCFEILTVIGRKLLVSKEPVVGNDTCIIGTVGDISVTMEKVASILQSDAEVESLKKSMDASYNLYYKTRPKPSKSAVDQSQGHLEALGGLNVVANTVHPSYAGVKSHGASAGAESGASTNDGPAEDDQEQGVSDPKQDADAASKNEILEFLHGFRPSSAKTTIVTTLPASSIATMERAKHYSRQFKKLDSSVPLPVDTSTDFEAVAIPRGHDVAPKQDFLVPSAASTAAQDELRLPNITLNITPDSEELMQKSRFQRKQHWDPKKKKFVQVTVDSITKRVIKDESGQKARGTVENKDLLKKWMKTTRKRIQKVGEQEEAPQRKKTANVVKFDDDDESGGDSDGDGDGKPNYDELIRMFPKHAATLESAKMKRPLTHKQKRTLKRLTTKPDFEKMRPETKGKKSAKGKKRTRLSQQEFRKKVERKIASKGAPRRSKLIVRKKRR